MDIGKLLGVPIPPMPLIYTMVALIVLLPLMVLLYGLRNPLIPRLLLALAGIVLVILTYAAYIYWKVRRLRLGGGLLG
jgi:hypothetical protein